MTIDIGPIPKFVIHFPERLDRKEIMDREYKRFFNDEEIEKIKEIHPIRLPEKHEAKISCFLSHKSAIQIAKDNNYPYVLIMEDDLYFSADDTRQHADLALQQAPDDWQLLSFGIYTGAIIPFNDYWYRIKAEWSATHMYLIRDTAYDTILAHDPVRKPNDAGKRPAKWKQFHYDRFLGKPKNVGGAALRCYVLKEMIALQSPGYSDLIRQTVDYHQMLDKYKIFGMDRIIPKRRWQR